jgi:hypothetical protein
MVNIFIYPLGGLILFASIIISVFIIVKLKKPEIIHNRAMERSESASSENPDVPHAIEYNNSSSIYYCEGDEHPSAGIALPSSSSAIRINDIEMLPNLEEVANQPHVIPYFVQIVK